MYTENKIDNKWFVLCAFAVVPLATYLGNLQMSAWVTQVTVIALISLIAISWAFFGKNDKTEDKSNTQRTADRFQERNNSRSVGLKLQGMGKLLLAFEKYKLCTHNHDTANLIYNLATDFQIKGEPENAKQAFVYIASFEPNFKDIQERIASFDGVISDNENIETHKSTKESVDIIAEEELFNTQEKRQLEDSKATLAGHSGTIIERAVQSGRTIILSPDEEPAKEIVMGDELDEYPTLYGSRYKIKDVLGQGTTGAVFRGKDIVTDQTIAIKVLSLSEELEDNHLEEYKFRFHREIETAGNLNHPNIVKIIDSGETDGYAYIAMEYVAGTNLRHYARADRLLHPKTVLKIIAQCADALAYSHKQDLIHRDIKPANIIYNKSDDYVKLTDFGIAKIPDSTRTRAGSILGTPLYMSPEQLAGDRLDSRSDLYSLGVTLYHLLTGSPPFRPKTMAELMRSITQEQHKDIAEINPGTPSCIAWSVNKALEKDPDKRFQSAASMANKLRECEMMLENY